jgi:hypothetical protein
MTGCPAGAANPSGEAVCRYIRRSGTLLPLQLDERMAATGQFRVSAIVEAP